MGKHNSHLLVAIAVIAVLVNAVFLLARLLIRAWHLGQPVALLLAIAAVGGIAVFYNWLMNKENREAKKRGDLP